MYCTFACDVGYVSIYETAGGCGISSNVYTNRVLSTDRLKGKPSDVDLCRASPNSSGQTTVGRAYVAEFTDTQ